MVGTPAAPVAAVVRGAWGVPDPGSGVAHTLGNGAGSFGGGAVGVAPGLVARVQRRLAAGGVAVTDMARLQAAVAEIIGEDGVVLPPAALAAVVRSIGDELTG